MVADSPALTQITVHALAAYAVTFVLASSSLLEKFRQWLIRRTPGMKIGNHKHFIECRMCVGFWATILIIIVDYQVINMIQILAVYGLSYFLATQER